MEKRLPARFREKIALIALAFLFLGYSAAAQSDAAIKEGKTRTGNKLPKGGKNTSPDLFGLFFEDINYAADGGLYAELVQNRSFEYNPAERREWHSLSYWEYITPGYSYGKISVENRQPLHSNNPNYVVLEVEHIHEKNGGTGIRNTGFGGIAVQTGEEYDFSLFARRLGQEQLSLTVSLQNKKGETLDSALLTIASGDWKKYSGRLKPRAGTDNAYLAVLVTSKGKLALDMVSLFPVKTFKNRPNGLRPDLAQLLADMHPRFIRFPGGCLAHGDGLGNMYRWKNTIGPVEERVDQRNIWGYHQTAGLGYYEYFQFCEDIGAKPLPVLPAAVSCQNSGGTWRIGGTGQQAIPLEEMQEYIQEVLDLIEWANGPATSTWGAKRAAAGHPAPFHLQYIGIGNEDKITPEFAERFTMIFKAVKEKHPEITVIGTVGPAPDGEDFEKGWTVANQLQVPVVDEHYYKEPSWFIANQYRYDGYDRKQPKVYLGEYASWGNAMKNALAEALYMVGLERNGDVVQLASYAPLFAKKGFTQWTPDMIFFTNTTYYLTPNYHVQQLFSANQGDYYYKDVIITTRGDSLMAASCVYNSETGDIVLKMINAGREEKTFSVNLGRFGRLPATAQLTILQADPDAVNSFAEPERIKPESSARTVSKKFNYTAKPHSVSVLRISTRK